MTLSPSQSISTVKVSSVPTSPIVPERVVVPFSRIDAAARPVSVGSTLSTVTFRPVLIPPPLIVAFWTPIDRVALSELRTSNTSKTGSNEEKLLWVGKPLTIELVMPIATPSAVGAKPLLPPMLGPSAATPGGRKL